MTVSEVVMTERKPYSKTGQTHFLKICSMVDGLGPHFLLAKSPIRWYLVLQRPRISSKCFLKVKLESKIIPRNFT